MAARAGVDEVEEEEDQQGDADGCADCFEDEGDHGGRDLLLWCGVWCVVGVEVGGLKGCVGGGEERFTHLCGEE